ncbi:hypothetical protein JHK87_047412 [Glycine soja]|nr:hypothetical protein JHK87_047412 [Glycine soja]
MWHTRFLQGRDQNVAEVTTPTNTILKSRITGEEDEIWSKAKSTVRDKEPIGLGLAKLDGTFWMWCEKLWFETLQVEMCGSSKRSKGWKTSGVSRHNG